MRISLLISEFKNDRERKICRGAQVAAEEEGVSLSIFPGMFLTEADHRKAKKDVFYQQNAVFSFINPENTDILIIDLEQIGRKVGAIKKEEFLKHFEPMKILLLSAMRGYWNVDSGEGRKSEELGYLAVKKAISLVKNQAEEEEIDKSIPLFEAPTTEALEKLEILSSFLIRSEFKKENPYEELMKDLSQAGTLEAALFLFPEAKKNTRRQPLKCPEEIYLMAYLSGGQVGSQKEFDCVKTSDFMSMVPNASERMTQIINVLYLGEKQVGLFVNRFTAEFMVPGFHSLFMDQICNAIRTIANEKQIEQMKELIEENTEAMERNDSVLDRFGTEDKLTGCLNRRGFFSKAYDLLKRFFVEGTYAVVSYIDMDSIKSINHFFGRDEGDLAMKKVASILREVFGQESILGRIRGDEFAVIRISEEEGCSESLRQEMSEQNMKLMTEQEKPYLIHLQYSICEFCFDKSLSLKEMLAETDEHLKKMKKIEEIQP